MQITKSRSIIPYIIAIVWPFLGGLYAFLNFRKSYAKNLFWILFGFFGFTFVISNNLMDASRYNQNLQNLFNEPNLGIKEFYERNYHIGRHSKIDFYKTFLIYFISRFTNSFGFLFLIVSIVCGYFSSRSLYLVIDRLEKPSRLVIALVCLLFFIMPFWGINGFRFFTAALVFIYGIMHYFIKDRFKYLFLVLISPLIHFSFLLPLAITLIYIIVGNHLKLYFFLVVLSFFISGISPEFIQNQILGITPDLFYAKVRGYTTDEYVQQGIKNSIGLNWYTYARTWARNIIMYGLIIIAFLGRKKFKLDKTMMKLLGYVCLYIAIIGFIENIPGVGKRFMQVGSFIAIAAGIIYLNKYISKRKQSFFYIPSLILTLIYVIVEIRIGCDYIGLQFLFSNFFLSPFIDSDIALINFFK